YLFFFAVITNFAIISIISSISFKFILHFSLCNLHFAIKRTLLTIYPFRNSLRENEVYFYSKSYGVPRIECVPIRLK
ncbi:MAG: hypothetical protein KJ629_05750, partial [Candidatus Omnitrophica bacterium]|nr:hypothetical protein [Candidatus Omnitrophota bacterium]